MLHMHAVFIAIIFVTLFNKKMRAERKHVLPVPGQRGDQPWTKYFGLKSLTICSPNNNFLLSMIVI